MGTMPCARSFGDFVGAAGEAVEARPAAHHRRRAQRHVTASDQQDPDHVCLVARRRGERCAPRKDLQMTFEITIKPSDHSFPCDGGRDRAGGGDARRPHAAVRVPQRRLRNVQGQDPGRRRRLRRAPGVDADRGREAHGSCALLLRQAAAPTSSIEVREVRRAGDIVIKRLPCRIESIDKAAPDVAIVRFKLPANERLQFLAGPVHRLPAEGRQAPQLLAGHRRRTTTSCSSCTSGTCPTASSPTRCSRNTRDARSCASRGRWARSTCARTSDKPIVFVAGGTGFAPIKAIIEHALHHKIDREMVLYWGARSLRRPLPARPARAVAARAHELHLRSRALRAQPEDNWTGRTGFVHRAVMEDFPDLSGHQVVRVRRAADDRRRQARLHAALRAAARRVLRRQLHLRRGNRSASVSHEPCCTANASSSSCRPTARRRRSKRAIAAIPHDLASPRIFSSAPERNLAPSPHIA